MSVTDTSAPSCAQADARKIATTQPQAIELQARKLRLRFALAPETARTLASIAFGGEARA
ncbi:hypothetical protein [Bradyrhizobium sp. DASA03120]|uniref:hypothetical protein n=1 Tax=Bradyrhizobium sp. SMVTL-02 TaxID=3395917 RepID=UPI003F700060